MTVPQGIILKGTIVANRIPQTGAIVNDNQYEDERATPRATVRVTDNSRLLESRDTRIPETVETITRTADAPRKRASPPQEGTTSCKRQASPPGSPERPTYVRTFTGDTDYNPQPQRVIQVHQNG